MSFVSLISSMNQHFTTKACNIGWGAIASRDYCGTDNMSPDTIEAMELLA